MTKAISEEQVRSRLSELYRRFGYLLFKVNKFEEYDLYAQYKNFLACKQVLTFSDTDGRLMALKPDVTLSVIKSASEACPIQKVFYNENVYRVPDDEDGFCEISQTGLECIGRVGTYETAEVIMLAARSLEAVSPDYVLDLSHVGVVSGILNEAGVSREDQPRFFAVLGSKNVPALKDLCAQFELSDKVCRDLTSLLALYGPVEDGLASLMEMDLPEESKKAAEELSALAALLAAYGNANLRLDFSVVDDIEYYNGIVFVGFIQGVAASVLSGGQYDRLMKSMKKPGGAIGFAVYFNELESLWTEKKEYDVDTVLVVPEERDLPAAIRSADAMAKAGVSVRVQQSEPEGYTYKNKVYVKNGEVVS